MKLTRVSMSLLLASSVIAADCPTTAMEDQAPAGRYSVTVRKAGYVDYTNGNVVLTSDGCHVRPVTLNSTLHPR